MSRETFGSAGERPWGVGTGKNQPVNLDLLARLFNDGPMPLVRTDFSFDEGWLRLVDEVTKESDLGDGDTYAPNVQPISDRGFEGTTP